MAKSWKGGRAGVVLVEEGEEDGKNGRNIDFSYFSISILILPFKKERKKVKGELTENLIFFPPFSAFFSSWVSKVLIIKM